jgi:hypothetical protein
LDFFFFGNWLLECCVLVPCRYVLTVGCIILEAFFPSFVPSNGPDLTDRL